MTGEYLKNARDPACSRMAMIGLGFKIRSLVESGSEFSHTKNLATFITMLKVVSIIPENSYNIAKEILHEGSRRDAYDDFRYGTYKPLDVYLYDQKLVDSPDSYDRDGFFPEVCETAAYKAGQLAKYILKSAPTENDRENYRAVYQACKQTVLFDLLKNFENQIKMIYSQALICAVNFQKTDPFPEKDTWSLYMEKHFHNLKEDTMLCFMPWLRHIVPIDKIQTCYQPFFIDFRNPLEWRQAAAFAVCNPRFCLLFFINF